MITGIIDLGSNTIRLSIYKCEDGKFRLLTNKKTMAGIISYIKDGVLSNKGIDKICEILNAYRELLDNFEITDCHCFSTASLRLISNKNEVLEEIERRTGIFVDLISGLEEAKLDFIGATLFTDLDEGVLIDIGGGSTELVSFQDGKMLESFSMPIGSLNTYNRFVKKILPCKGERAEIRNEVILNLERSKTSAIAKERYQKAIGVGGTARAVLALYNDIFGYPKNNRQFETAQVKKMLQLLKDNGKSTVQKILQIAPDRIHTLIPGMVVLYTVLKNFGIESVTVSTSGVREGYLYHKVMKKEGCGNESDCL